MTADDTRRLWQELSHTKRAMRSELRQAAKTADVLRDEIKRASARAYARGVKDAASVVRHNVQGFADLDIVARAIEDILLPEDGGK